LNLKDILLRKQAEPKGSGLERFTLVLETNCIIQLERKLAQIILRAYNHNPVDRNH